MAEYLAIKNWDKYQPGRKGKSEWIKDYTSKDEDEDYEKLSLFQRQVLDSVRRLRGRLGKNPPNDAGYIARAMHAIGTDRPHIGHAISTLVSRGFLVIVNQSLDTQPQPQNKNKEIDKEKKEPTKPPRSASAESAFDRAWQHYPRKVGKFAAQNAWNFAVKTVMEQKAIPKPDAEDFLYQRIMTYDAACTQAHRERRFIPHPVTWLRQGRYMDDPMEWTAVNGAERPQKSKLQESLDVIDKVEF